MTTNCSPTLKWSKTQILITPSLVTLGGKKRRGMATFVAHPRRMGRRESNPQADSSNVLAAMASSYGFLQGAWPFGIVEFVWSLVAIRRWWRKSFVQNEKQLAANFCDETPLFPSRGDWMAIELFLTALRTWPEGLLLAMPASAARKATSPT
jgi:hypothetical protein